MKKILLPLAVFIAALLAVFAAACAENPSSAGYTVELNTRSVSLMALERFELKAVVKDGGANEVRQQVSWSSADESVAKVSDGVIFAVGAGVTEVTATISDNAYAKCSVTVTDDGVIPELRVNAKTLTLGKEQKFTLLPAVFFNGADCTESDTVFTYVTFGGIVRVSDDGIITAKAAGNTKITVYALWRGIGGPENIGDESVIVGLSLTIDVTVVVL